MADLRFISDDGHGWLEVPTADVATAGVTPSRYSYVDADQGLTYLEEDMDASAYLYATGIISDSAVPPANPANIKETHIDGDAWIRDLPRCGAEVQAEPLRYPAGTPQYRVLERAARQYGDRLRIEPKRRTVTTLQGDTETGWIVNGRAHGGGNVGIVFPGPRQQAQDAIDAVAS